MIGAGTIINPIIKIVTTVAILAAVGIFIVRPILDTTEKTISEVNESVRQSQEQAQQRSHELTQNIALETAQSRTSSFIASLNSTWPEAAREIRSCLKRAEDQLTPTQKCERFAERVVHNVQSSRNFALSYATCVAAQGDAGGAVRIEQCVKDAGYESRAMQRCRDLADQLLFG